MGGESGGGEGGGEEWDRVGCCGRGGRRPASGAAATPTDLDRMPSRRRPTPTSTPSRQAPRLAAALGRRGLRATWIGPPDLEGRDGAVVGAVSAAHRRLPGGGGGAGGAEFDFADPLPPVPLSVLTGSAQCLLPPSPGLSEAERRGEKASGERSAAGKGPAALSPSSVTVTVVVVDDVEGLPPRPADPAAASPLEDLLGALSDAAAGSESASVPVGAPPRLCVVLCLRTNARALSARVGPVTLSGLALAEIGGARCRAASTWAAAATTSDGAASAVATANVDACLARIDGPRSASETAVAACLLDGAGGGCHPSAGVARLLMDVDLAWSGCPDRAIRNAGLARSLHAAGSGPGGRGGAALDLAASYLERGQVTRARRLTRLPSVAALLESIAPATALKSDNDDDAALAARLAPVLAALRLRRARHLCLRWLRAASFHILPAASRPGLDWLLEAADDPGAWRCDDAPPTTARQPRSSAPRRGGSRGSTAATTSAITAADAPPSSSTPPRGSALADELCRRLRGAPDAMARALGRSWATEAEGVEGCGEDEWDGDDAALRSWGRRARRLAGGDDGETDTDDEDDGNGAATRRPAPRGAAVAAAAGLTAAAPRSRAARLVGRAAADAPAAVPAVQRERDASDDASDDAKADVDPSTPGARAARLLRRLVVAARFGRDEDDEEGETTFPPWARRLGVHDDASGALAAALVRRPREEDEAWLRAAGRARLAPPGAGGRGGGWDGAGADGDLGAIWALMHRIHDARAGGGAAVPEAAGSAATAASSRGKRRRCGAASGGADAASLVPEPPSRRRRGELERRMKIESPNGPNNADAPDADPDAPDEDASDDVDGGPSRPVPAAVNVWAPTVRVWAAFAALPPGAVSAVPPPGVDAAVAAGAQLAGGGAVLPAGRGSGAAAVAAAKRGGGRRGRAGAPPPATDGAGAPLGAAARRARAWLGRWARFRVAVDGLTRVGLVRPGRRGGGDALLRAPWGWDA